MKYTNIIEDIRTIRDFKKEEVPNNLIDEIIIDAQDSLLAGRRDDVSITFIKNGQKLFNTLSGKAGYFGKMIEAPHYILISSKKFEGYVENSAYIMENLRLKAWNIGLGTCWLSIEDEKELFTTLNIDKEFIPISLIAIGYQYKGFFKKDTSPRSSRLGVEDIIFDGQWGKQCTTEMLEARGIVNILYYSRLAPSWGNLQPWRFILDDNKIVLAIVDKDILQHLDAGIVMLYFEKSAHEEGILGKWRLDISNTDKYNIPEGYKALGYFEV
ncbi:nitroreductase family protein [Proteiniborus sp. MB09-C3]|uniref:nitroreductase family protein n=1 Tax=Proteiniborus sp. MB09-C3 TaxID=3050072 RepID=UPI002554C9A8|nr:nitroreductase family protein [Proteiniborus sp. MB09-C3]WIV13866.1 nitroreductase family protein [Proteiniborus sp. MB09-C3]